LRDILSTFLRIEMLDASLGDTSRVLNHWGMGARELLGKADTH
jgi:hypothetical protein